MHRSSARGGSSGFTLIEILVAIAIVGILASIVFASLSSARDAARLSAGLQFDSSLRQQIGANMIGEWKFEEASGGATALDSYGSNNATISGTVSRVAGVSGQGVSFDGSTNYLTIPGNVLGGLTIFTISFWIKTTDMNTGSPFYNYPAMVGFQTAGAGSQDFGITTNAGILGMWAGLTTSLDSGMITTVNISDNKWHQITAVNDGTKISLYLDGASVGGTIPSGLALGGTAFGVGKGISGPYHQGVYDEVRIYSSALTAEVVGKQYASEAPRYLVAQK